MSAFRAIIPSFFYGLLLLSKLYIFSALTRFLGTKTLEVAGDLFGFLDLAVGCGMMMEFSVGAMGDIIWWYPLHPFGIPEGIYISVVDYLYQTWCDFSWWGSQRSSSIGAVTAVQNFTEKVNVDTMATTSLGNVSDSSVPGTLSGTLWFFSDTLHSSPSRLNFTTPPLISHLIYSSSIDNISSRGDLTGIRLETHLVWVLPMIIISSAVFMFYGAKSDTGSRGGSPCSKILDSLSNTNRKASSLAGSSNGSDAPPVDTPTTLPLGCADLKLGTVLLFPFDLETGTPNDSNHTAASDLLKCEDAELGTSRPSDIYLGARSEDVPPTLAAAFTRTIPSSGDLVGQDGTPENLVIISASSGILASSQTAACSCLSDLVLQYQMSTLLCDDPVVSEITPRDDAADKLVIDPNPVASISDTSDTGDVDLTCQEDVINGSNISLANPNTGGNSLSAGAVLLDGSEVSMSSDPLRSCAISLDALPTPPKAIDVLDRLVVGTPNVRSEPPCYQQNVRNNLGDEGRLGDLNALICMGRSMSVGNGRYSEPEAFKAHQNIYNEAKTANPFGTSVEVLSTEAAPGYSESDTSEGESDLTCLSTQPSSTMGDLFIPSSKSWDILSISDDCPPSPHPADFTILAELPAEVKKFSVLQQPPTAQTDEIARQQLFDAIHLRMFSRPRSSRLATRQQPTSNPLAVEPIPQKGVPNQSPAPKARAIPGSVTRSNIGTKRPRRLTASPPSARPDASGHTHKTRRPTMSRDRSGASRVSREQGPKHAPQRRLSRRSTSNDLTKLFSNPHGLKLDAPRR